MDERLRFYSISPVDILYEADQLLLSPALQSSFIRFALVCLKDGGCLDTPKVIARAAKLTPEDAEILRQEIDDICEVRDGKVAPKLIWGLIEHAEMKSQKARNSALAKGSQRLETQANEGDSSPKTKKRKRTQANASERALSEVKLREEKLSTGTNVPGADAPDESPDQESSSPTEEPPPSPSVAFKRLVTSAFCGLLAELDAEAPPYAPTAADVIQVEALRKRCDKTGWPLTPERLQRALANYRASPLGERTLADFAVRFSTFFSNALDRFGKAVTTEAQANGTTSGSNGIQTVAGSVPSESGTGGKWAAREF